MPYPTTFQFISEKDVKTFKKTNCSELFVKPILKGYDLDTNILSNDGQILMTELIWHVAGKKIGSTELAQTLLNADIFQAVEDDEEENSSSSSNRNNNLASWFLDTIWNVYNEIDSTRTTILDLVEQNEELDPGMELDDAEEQAENLGKFVRSLTKLENGSRTIFFDLAMEQLSLTMLHDAKLIPGAPKDSRSKLVKKNTANYYTQQNYNLLGEESEGFAKIIIELNEVASRTTNISANANDSDNNGNGSAVLHRIKSLIGYFNLDPNRTCDLVFEALENCLGRGEEMLTGKSCGILGLVEILQIFRKSTICHILGRRFHYHEVDEDKSASDDGAAKDNNNSSSSSNGKKRNGKKDQENNKKKINPLPPRSMSLCRVAALLIASDLLETDDILPHLLPHEKDLRKKREEATTHLLSKAGGIGKVKLGASKEQREAEEKEKLVKERKLNEEFKVFSNANQKYGILCGLYDLNAWNSSKTYVKKLEDVGGKPLTDTNVIQHLCNMGKNILQPVYENLPGNVYPVKLKLAKKKNYNVNNSYNDSHASLYSMYDQCSSTKTVASKIGPIVMRLGEQVGKDLVFYVRVCRTLAYSIKFDNALEEDSQRRWIFPLLEKCLIPAISTLEGNIGAVSEMWNVLKLVPYNLRYKCYAYWKTYSYLKKDDLIHAGAKAKNFTKLIMRRLAKENVITQGMKLAKIGLSNPLIVFGTIIDQIEIYDNMIQPVVESFKYLSPLSYDVVAFCIIDKLTSSRDKLKSDGTNVSSWLQSLSLFTGTFFRRYPFVEHRGILQYVIQSLQSTNTVDSVNLIVLKELVGSMTGIIVMEDVSKTQLEGRAGGPELIFQSSMFKEMEGSIDKSRRFLAESLMSTPLLSTGKKEPFAVVLLILIAKKLRQIAYATTSKELKLIGNLYDQCHMTMLQLIQFFVVLKMNVQNTRSDLWYVKVLPPIEELLETYLLEPAIAFALAQPSFKLLTSPDGKVQKKSVIANLQKNWGYQNLSKKLPNYLSSDVLEHISVDLYLSFWTMNIYDLYYPKKRYESELKTIQSDVQKIRGNGRLSNSEKKTIRKKESVMKTLKEEMKAQQLHVEKTIKMLKSKKEKWVSGTGANDKTVEMFLQHCIMPRLQQGPEDAFYCSLFTNLLHDSNTLGWNSLHYNDQILKCVPLMVHCSTEREAASIGLFLSETIIPLNKWCKEDEYKTNCMVKSNVFRKDSANHQKGNEVESIEFEFYKKGFKFWNRLLTRVFSAALTGNVYLTVRNTLLVMSKIVYQYPNDKKTMAKIVNVVNKLVETEKKADIKTVAKNYGVMLQKRKKEDPTLDANPPQKKAVKKEYNFDDDDGDSSSKDTVAKAAINNEGDKKLRKEFMSPVAKDFKPAAKTGSPSVLKKTGGKEEIEDGELKPSTTTKDTSHNDKNDNSRGKTNNMKRKRWVGEGNSNNSSNSNNNNSRDGRSGQGRWGDPGKNGSRRWSNEGNGTRRNSGGWGDRSGNRDRLPPSSNNNNRNHNNKRWSESSKKDGSSSSSSIRNSSSQKPPSRPSSSAADKSRNNEQRRWGNDSKNDNKNDSRSSNNNQRTGNNNGNNSRPAPSTNQPPSRPTSSNDNRNNNINQRRWGNDSKNDNKNDSKSSNNIQRTGNSNGNNSRPAPSTNQPPSRPTSSNDNRNNNNNKRKRGTSPQPPPSNNNNNNNNKRARIGGNDKKTSGTFRRGGGNNNNNNNRNRGGNRNGGGGAGRSGNRRR